MKAWLVKERDGEDATVVFADTRGKARSIAMHTEACEDAEFCDIEVHREPQMDKYYTSGKIEMDWYDDKDRIALVKHCSFQCADECECELEECPAYKMCGRYEVEREAVEDMAEAMKEITESKDES